MATKSQQAKLSEEEKTSTSHVVSSAEQTTAAEWQPKKEDVLTQRRESKAEKHLRKQRLEPVRVYMRYSILCVS
jgi:hypothetical protein